MAKRETFRLSDEPMNFCSSRSKSRHPAENEYPRDFSGLPAPAALTEAMCGTIGSSGNIVCIGWGSLIWQPKELPIVGQWHFDGPELPIEFVRHSGQGTGEDKLTLVLASGRTEVITRWATLDVADLEEARSVLRKREGCRLGDIGFYPGGSSNEFADKIGKWAIGKNLAGVVWTALPPKFFNENGRSPTPDEALAFVSSLPSKARELAEQYVRMAPKAVRTPYRESFERELGWLSQAKD